MLPINCLILLSLLIAWSPAALALQSFSEYQLQRDTLVNPIQQQLNAQSPMIQVQLPSANQPQQQTTKSQATESQPTWQRQNPWKNTTTNPWQGQKVRTQGTPKSAAEKPATQSDDKGQQAPTKPNIFAPGGNTTKPADDNIFN